MMRAKKNRRILSSIFSLGFLTLGLLTHSNFAVAGVLDINFIDPNNLGGLLPQNVADQAIKMFAIYTVHRPYSGATSIFSSNTLDINAEVSLVKIGDGVLDALRADGLTVSTPAAPAVPMAKLNLRKAFSENFDLGFSGLSYAGQEILGGDLKFVLVNADEGLSWALRLGYTYASVPYAYVTSCNTFSPELVVSQKLNYAEPYLGIGGRYMFGTVSVPITASIPGVPGGAITKNITKSGKSTTGYAFTGVYFRILGSQGLRIGMEGTFDLSGYSTVGTVVGLGF